MHAEIYAVCRCIDNDNDLDLTTEVKHFKTSSLIKLAILLASYTKRGEKKKGLSYPNLTPDRIEMNHTYVCWVTYYHKQIIMSTVAHLWTRKFQLHTPEAQASIENVV